MLQPELGPFFCMRRISTTLSLTGIGIETTAQNPPPQNKIKNLLHPDLLVFIFRAFFRGSLGRVRIGFTSAIIVG